MATPTSTALENFLNPHIQSAANFFGVTISQQQQTRINRNLATISPIIVPSFQKASGFINSITDWIMTQINCNQNDQVGRITKCILNVLVGIGIAVIALKAAGFIMAFSATILVHCIITLFTLAIVVSILAIGVSYLRENGTLRPSQPR